MYDEKKIEDIDNLEKKMDSIINYLYKCDDFTQTGSTFYKDSCISRQFKEYRRFSEEYSIILNYMKSEDLVEYWSCDKVHHSYYKLTSKSLRNFNLNILCQ